MNRLFSSVMRGIGKKRRRDTEAGDSSSDDEAQDPDFSPDSNDSYPTGSKRPRSSRKTAAETTGTKAATKTNGEAKAATKTSRTKTASRTSGTKAASKTNNEANAATRTSGTRTATKTSSGKKSPTKASGSRKSNSTTDNGSRGTKTTEQALAASAVGLLNLPMDILVHIVQLVADEQGILATVCALSGVCRRLRHFATAELPSYAALWRRADLSGLGHRMSLATLHSVALPRFPGLVALNLEGWSGLRDKDIETICSAYGTTLAEVWLAGSDHLSGRTVVSLTEGCRELRLLSLTRVSHRVVHGQLVAQLIRRHAGSLACLTLDSVQGEIVGFGALLGQLMSPEGLPRLQRLRLAHLRASSRREAALDAAALAICAPALQHLELVNLQLGAGLSFLSGGSGQFSGLRHLLVQELPHPHRVTLAPAALPRLTSLCIVAADFEVANADSWDSSSCCRLTRLVVTHCPNAEAGLLLPLLEKVAPTLAVLDFTCSVGIGLSGDEDSERIVALLASLPRLRQLNLTGTLVSLASARRFALSVGSLVELNLTSCKLLPRGFKQHLLTLGDIEAWLARNPPSDDEAG